MDNRTLVDNRTLIAPSGGDRTQVVNTPSGGVKTQMGASLTCPVCDTQNAWGTEWCGECGFRLDATPGETPSPDQTLPPAQLMDAAGKIYPLQRGINTLGRQDTTVLLNDPTVSRKHAQILVGEDGGVSIEDLGSSNGTKVDGERIGTAEQRALQTGSALTLGSVDLTLEINELTAAPSAEEPMTEEAPPTEEEIQAAAQVETETLHGESGDASYVEESMLDEGTDEPQSEAGEFVDPRLILASGTGVDLREGVTTLGRRDTNDVTLSDSYTSGSHAQFVRTGDAVELIDQNSTNGTFVNGNRLPPGGRATLKDGDLLTFGQTEVRFAAPNEISETGEE